MWSKIIQFTALHTGGIYRSCFMNLIISILRQIQYRKFVLVNLSIIYNILCSHFYKLFSYLCSDKMAVKPTKPTRLASIYSISILCMVIIGTVIAMLPTLMVRDQHQNVAFAQIATPTNKPAVIVCKDVTGTDPPEGPKVGLIKEFKINVEWERNFGPPQADADSFLLKDEQCKISTLSRSMLSFPAWDFKVTEEPNVNFVTEYIGQCEADGINSVDPELFRCTVTNIKKYSCEECFTNSLSGNKVQDLLDLIIESDLEKLCETLEAGGYTEARLRDLLKSTINNDVTINNIIECLKNAGVFPDNE
jgi:hypothetical protein